MWDVLLTDDKGAYLTLTAFGRLVRREKGEQDVLIADSIADWVWDRVAAFGGGGGTTRVRGVPRSRRTEARDMRPTFEMKIGLTL